MKAILLAAGYATRLYPLTRDRAKPLLDVGGRAVLDYILDRVLRDDRIDEVTVVANARFYDQFVEWLETRSTTVKVLLLNDGSTDESNRLGAVADLALGIRASNARARDDHLVVAGDNLFEFDLSPLVDAFLEQRQTYMHYRRLDDVPKARYGEVHLGQGTRVIEFREKPEVPKTNTVATPFYVFPSDIDEHLERYLSGGGNPDAPGHFIQWLVTVQPVHAIATGGPLIDIGNHESLERARREYGTRSADGLTGGPGQSL